MRASLLGWQQKRYLKWSLVLGLLAVLLYATQGGGAPQPANGGTWQGYVLGTVGALLIVWLSLLGIRKRSYSSNQGTVQGWTSAHVYLGGMLLVVATLHCAGQFGWNVHTLAYALMCLVIASGFYGLYAYIHLPTRAAANSAGRDREAWFNELADLDERIRDNAGHSDANLQATVLSAVELTRLGGSLREQLMATDRSQVQLAEIGGKAVANSEQSAVIKLLAARIPDTHKQAEAKVLNQLLSLFGRRQAVLQLLRRDIQFRGLMKIWLYFHIPLTVALLVALTIHIFVVFFYW
jgi:hypothetical protein